MKKVKFYKGDMISYEIYKLVDFYDPILRTPTKPVKLENLEDFKAAEYIAFSLAETLGELQGLGLSANQVGLPHRVCAINMGNQIWTMFNPEIIERSTVPSTYEEGCLSYPGLYVKVPRSEWIKIKFQAIGGQWIEETFSGLTAVCVQHELDHLDGIVYTDKISPIKLDQAKRKVKKNLKKMRDAAKQIAIEQAIAEKNKPAKPKIATEKEPEIKIVDNLNTLGLAAPIPTENPQEKPSKFVYEARVS